MKLSLPGEDAFQFFLEGPNNGTKLSEVLFFEDSVLRPVHYILCL